MKATSDVPGKGWTRFSTPGDCNPSQERSHHAASPDQQQLRADEDMMTIKDHSS